MENNAFIGKYESTLKEAMRRFLLAKGEVDEMLPDAPDIEEKWAAICMAYLPDGVREFNAYPTVSLGWMAFVGMAVAQFWDEDWSKYAPIDNLYTMLRDVRGFDFMDKYICQDVLKLAANEAASTSRLVADLASLSHHALMREGFEPGTPEAFNAYVRTLYNLYTFGAAVQLKRLGYHMSKLG